MTKEVHETEELIVHKHQIACMTHDKVLNNAKPLCSQGSLSVMKEVNSNDHNEIEPVDALVMLPGERRATHVDPNWKETTVRVRKHCLLL